MSHKIFIGCSSEQKCLGEKIEAFLRSQEELGLDAQCWSSDFFESGDYTLDRLREGIDEAEAAIFILSPDDIVDSREIKQDAPRDNVILEMGMSYQKLGREGTICLLPVDAKIKVPSDLKGITMIEYAICAEGSVTEEKYLFKIIKKLKKIIGSNAKSDFKKKLAKKPMLRSLYFFLCVLAALLCYGTYAAVPLNDINIILGMYGAAVICNAFALIMCLYFSNIISKNKIQI